MVEAASSSLVTQTIKGVHNTFELWTPFIFWVKVLACGHSAKPSAVIDGILGVVGWASKNLLNDGFYAAKSTKQGENGKNLRLFAIFDYATWQGSASSVACDLALRARSLVCYSAGVHAELNAMFHSDQIRPILTRVGLLFWIWFQPWCMLCIRRLGRSQARYSVAPLLTLRPEKALKTLSFQGFFFILVHR